MALTCTADEESNVNCDVQQFQMISNMQTYKCISYECSDNTSLV